MSDEPKLAVWQYYYKDNACPAEYSRSENCICWHNEGSGPFPKLKNGDDIPLAYGGAFGLTWRRVPAPAVPDDVAEPWRTMLRQAEDDLRKAHATIEAQAAELARLREVLENEAYEFSERHEVSGFYVARRIRAALTHPTGGSND